MKPAAWRIGPLLLTLAVSCLLAAAATRPRYGGTLRVEVRVNIETADPPQAGPGMADLAGAFSITRWEGGHLAVYTANDDAPGGRPYLDQVEIEMARPYREQAVDLELGRADLVELGINEARRSAAGRRIWSSEPVRLLALSFGARISDTRVREALALAIDRAAIHNVLLQRQGEIAGSLLPQWISGYAFLFPTVPDSARARALTGSLPLEARTLSLRVDPEWRTMADRIALNARDAGLVVSPALANANADLRLIEVRITSSDPAEALASLAAALGLPEPPRGASAEGLLAAERSYLADFKVIPLFHLPYAYGVGPRVRGGPGITPLGEWRFENLWLENPRP
jgi:MarR-like DNA-binding transcriptional regulator SgrR of sgrS sRNA